MPLAHDDNRVQQIVSEAMSDFRTEMFSAISSEMRTLFQNLNINSSRNDDSLRQQRPEGNGVTNRQRSAETSNTNSTQKLTTDKVASLIHNWHIKFSGSNSDISVEEFIYRINILTSIHLKDDFNLICQHAHSLFEGKAKQWFWRYHRLTTDLNWFSLCEALKRQFKDDLTDYDIKDDIRQRKQKQNESFDDFMDAISSLCDKLKTQMSEAELVETVLRNLKPDLRHELLHLELNSIVALRKEVRRNEKFMRDLKGSADLRQKSERKQVQELYHVLDDKVDKDDVEDNDIEVNAIERSSSLKCWNCDELGHSYHDCLKDKRVFCYGCGAVDTYKPTCPKCSKKSENSSQDVRRNPKGHPTQHKFPRN